MDVSLERERECDDEREEDVIELKKSEGERECTYIKAQREGNKMARNVNDWVL